MSTGVFVDIIVVLSYHIIYCFIYTKEFIDFYENYMYIMNQKCSALVSRATPSFGAQHNAHAHVLEAMSSIDKLLVQGKFSPMQRGTVLGEGADLLETLLYVFKTMGCTEV